MGATFLWTSVFVILVAELVITFFLCLPLPDMVHGNLARLLLDSPLLKGIMFVLQFLAMGLVVAIADAFTSIKGLKEKIAEQTSQDRTILLQQALDKQRLFRTERNLYLAGFCLALLFVIGRLLSLMKRNLALRRALKEAEAKSSDVQSTTTTSAQTATPVKGSAAKKSD